MLRGYISGRMQKTKTPALSIAMLEGGRIAYSRGFGFRDVEKLLPADGDTLYGIGSVTKSFTALAILQLQDRGLLNVHDRVGKHLQEFGTGSPLSNVEIVNLLNHSSGFPSLNVAEITLMRQFGMDTSFIPMAGYEDFVDLVNSSAGEKVAPPGKKFMYWNEGYTLLGRIIEKVSRESYTDYVHRHILEPLRMERSGFGQGKTADDINTATFYNPSPDGKHKPTPLRSQEFDVAAGGLISSPNELCNYLRLMIEGGTFGGRRIVSASALKEATTGGIDEEQPSQFGDARYGFGWSVVDSFFGHRLVSHSGDVGVSSSYVGYVPDLGIGVAVASNIGAGPMSSVGVYALACLAGKEPERDVVTVMAEQLAESIKGEYSDFRSYTTLTVSEWGEGYLKAEFKSNEMSFSMPLIVDGTQLYTVASYRRSPVHYRRTADGATELLFERHRFVKR